MFLRRRHLIWSALQRESNVGAGTLAAASPLPSGPVPQAPIPKFLLPNVLSLYRAAISEPVTAMGRIQIWWLGARSTAAYCGELQRPWGTAVDK